MYLALQATTAFATEMGANKVDLAGDYIAASPPFGADPQGYARVRRAMGKKAIFDARDAGLRFFRVAITGYSPSAFNTPRHDLSPWLEDPARYWAALDAMFDDLDAGGLRLVPSFIWNIGQFPAIGGDDIGTFVRAPNSASRKLLARYVSEFVNRYKGRKTILFYEMGNEMNLLVDLDARKGCTRDPCIAGNFTTADMTNFAWQFVDMVKQLDPTRPVTSGYSLPRPGATHLAARPQFSATGADWTADTASEFDQELLSTQAPFDIVSVHVYPADETRPSGPKSGVFFDPVIEAAKTVHAARKKLFVGEYGDNNGATPFMDHLLTKMVRADVDYSAIWVWEFYQSSTHQTRDTDASRASVEPGYSDDLVALLKRTVEHSGSAPPTPAVVPRVVLTWPLPCTNVDHTSELYAVASDGAKPPRTVEFLLDGEPIGVATGPPYRLDFTTDGKRPGLAHLAARATAGSGATASFSSDVHLNGSTTACGAQGTSP